MKNILLFSCSLICFVSFSVTAQKKEPKSNNASAIQRSDSKLPVLSNSHYKKTKSGLEYRIVNDSSGKNFPEKGGFITFWFQTRNERDSILENQIKDPNPVGIPVPEVKYSASIEEGFYLLTDGDSAVFLLNADSLYSKTFYQPLPNHIKQGSMIKMIVKMDKVYSKKFVDSVMAIQEKKLQEEAETEKIVYKRDSIAIQDYLKKHNLKGQSTIGGAYIVILKENNLEKHSFSPGDSVKTSYIGSLLIEGTEFDKSAPGKPFKFTVGMGMVIKGWDEGFQKLKKGEKALILIPSRLAYGSRGAGDSIPSNAPLLFEVEIEK
jgi:FKBP-type peptidyl-prolyl cis-trans isomerase FkpA